jgi:hypothetical protein
MSTLLSFLTDAATVMLTIPFDKSIFATDLLYKKYVIEKNAL